MLSPGWSIQVRLQVAASLRQHGEANQASGPPTAATTNATVTRTATKTACFFCPKPSMLPLPRNLHFVIPCLIIMKQLEDVSYDTWENIHLRIHDPPYHSAMGKKHSWRMARFFSATPQSRIQRIGLPEPLVRFVSMFLHPTILYLE